MTDLAAALRRQADRPVEDHTGVSGSFDFHMEWSPDEIPDSTNPSLFTALKEQLGLKLQPAKGSIPLFVIDRIAPPSPD
ncbi:TIGR03435 family protein [Silvibacterium sp.]|uniref:TIGR03435 family protein n=1 Tax=Silvibacterium sp. TaxID=1964179 RepID=UPI0039E41659